MGSLFSSPKSPPPPSAPVTMPVEDQASIAAAQQKQAQAAAMRSGRASTILSQGNNGTDQKLGD